MLNAGEKNIEENTISDTEVPGTTPDKELDIDMEVPDTTSEAEKDVDTEASKITTPNDKIDIDTTVAPEENQNKEDETSWKDSIRVDSNITTDYAQQQIDNLIEQLESFELGNSVSLSEGVNYTEDSLGGGQQGDIGGVQWRPTGDYIVNGVSIVNPSTNQIITYSNMDLSTNVVTISVPGEEKTINENFNLNEYLKENLQKGMEVRFHIDKDGTKPTGWIDSSHIIESLENTQETPENEINLNI